MDSTCFTTVNLDNGGLNCERIFGFLLRALLSSLRCVRTHRPRRFGSLLQLADITGFQQVGSTYYYRIPVVELFKSFIEKLVVLVLVSRYLCCLIVLPGR